ncbi:hypothetical protein CHU98_g9242 [Xylaria longipes]|nr:hypothetical protein CHU98_g9242 [Xylaria longipes]
MASLLRPRAADRGLLAVKPSSPRASSSGGHAQASGSGSASGSRDGKRVQSEPVVMKPWANQPWPLIETPSRTQQITHPALHIANEIAHIHNAMLRGLNAIYLQAPHVKQAQDIADLAFLTQSWSTWLLDHHDLKESTMLPGFEAALRVPARTLTLSRSRSPSAASFRLDGDMKTTMEEGNGQGDEELISFLLHRVYAYASATHKDPQAYDATTLCGLLAALADTLVPHLAGQVGLLVSMREMCSSSSAASGPSSRRNEKIPAPLPMPMVAITRAGSSNMLPSPPVSPASSTFSSASAAASIRSASSSSHSPPTVSLSLFPSSSTARPHHHHGKNGNRHNNTPDNPTAKNMEVVDAEAKDRLARARALLEADDRATKLTQAYLAADARASATMDRFVVLPMIVRLRDVTTGFPTPTPTPIPTPTLSRTASSSSLSRMSMNSAGMSMFGGVGGNAASEWPRMSIPAVHAIADKLSPRHEGAWRFLPCDVWGRPRELPFWG